MFKIVRSTTYVLMIVLGSIASMGVIVGGQQYFFLQAVKEMALTQRTLDESFLITMKVMGGESNSKMDKELALQKEIIEGVDSSVAAMIRQLEIRAIADVIAWGVIFIISVWALILNNRKQA